MALLPERVLVSQGAPLVGLWLPKDAAEVVVLGLDVAADMSPEDQITEAVWTVVPQQVAVAGLDLVVGASQVVATLVDVSVSLGVGGGRYLLTCTVTLESGAVIRRMGLVSVLASGVAFGGFSSDDFGQGFVGAT